MKTGIVHISNNEYTVVVNTALLMAIEDRTGKPAGEAFDDILSSGSLKDMMWLLHEMMVQGKAYCDLIGTPCKEPPAIKDMGTLIGVDEFKDLIKVMADSSKDSQEPDIDSISKNQQATE